MPSCPYPEPYAPVFVPFLLLHLRKPGSLNAANADVHWADPRQPPAFTDYAVRMTDLDRLMLLTNAKAFDRILVT
jgi:hypothetical protein